MLSMGINSGDECTVERALESIEISSTIAGNRCMISISGNQVEDKILRLMEINNHVTQFAHIVCVRNFLFNCQRNHISIVCEHFFGLAIESRDMTSVTFPDADLRFFLHANMDKREQHQNRDMATDSIAKRDSVDECVTLWQDDAIRIDTSFHNLRSIVNIISRYVEEL
jgi:cytidylate kinase